MKYISRRSLLKKSAAALGIAAVPLIRDGRANAQVITDCLVGHYKDPDTPDFKHLVQTGVESAKKAGASFADVSIRITTKQTWQWWSATNYPVPYESFAVSVGVRALFNGYWGFAGVEGLVSADEMVQLAQDAVSQGKNSSNSSGKLRDIKLADVPVVSDGRWATPIEIDPFTVSNEEKIDFMCAVMDYMRRERVQVNFPGAGLQFLKVDNTFASSDGSDFQQTSYTSGCNIYVNIEKHFANEEQGARQAGFITSAGAGWEYILKTPFREKVPEFIEHTARSRYGKPVNVGRYDIVFNACSMANFIDGTIAPATRVDRVFGYLADSVGTSFLSDPLAMLGSYRLGSNLVNITASRSIKGGAATVKWDDEGAEPQDAVLVTNGILTDMQTTRESANWLAPYYDKTGIPVRSNGCAARETAGTSTLQCSSNFLMAPGKEDTTFNDMIASTKRGLAVIDSRTTSDHQALNGSGTYGVVYEIRDGKLGNVVLGSSLLYRTPEFWRNIVEIGGTNSVESFGFPRSRFGNEIPYTIAAVPAKVTGVAVTDLKRKA